LVELWSDTKWSGKGLDDSRHDQAESPANPVRAAVRNFGGIYMDLHWSPWLSSNHFFQKKIASAKKLNS